MRILQNTAGVLRVAITNADGDPVDATGTPTVTVTRDDGIVLASAQNATKPADTAGVYQYVLEPADTASLGVVTAAWSATVDGYAQTFTTQDEIVGAHLCSLMDIDRFLNRGGTASRYSPEAKLYARDAASDAIEEECGRVFSRRSVTAYFDGGTRVLPLPFVGPATIRSLTVDGVDYTQDELAELILTGNGTVIGPGTFPYGTGNITARFDVGPFRPPADIARAVALLASSMLADGPWDDRGFGIADEGGVVRLLTAGVSGAAFSIPEVEATVRRHRLVTVVA